MNCQWQSVLGVLPGWMRENVDKVGREGLQELRLRLGQPPRLCMGDDQKALSQIVSAEDLKFVINTASRYSPWACTSVSKGYITIPGGHRIGIAGDTIVNQAVVSGVRWVSSLCIRISRDFPEISKSVTTKGSVLIIGVPGSGKTTLLRDAIRARSDEGPGSICVVDERLEIFPVSQDRFCYYPGKRTDVLSGCPKSHGVDMAVRCMGPSTVAVDEITAEQDCKALINAGWCGVDVLATAHAASKQELMTRPVYKPLLQMGLFQTLVVMHKDKSYHTERMT